MFDNIKDFFRRKNHSKKVVYQIEKCKGRWCLRSRRFGSAYCAKCSRKYRHRNS